ncbi:MAG: hypothetical protein HY667_06460, partial [Chloroflexi bacterium]|nr:hypothetical protein [Chloroflexota bacterium]
VSGAAASRLVAESLGTILALWYLSTRRTRLRLTFSGFWPDFSMIRRLVRIGLPACIMNLQSSASLIVMTGFMAAFGTLAVAAHGLMGRVSLIFFLPGYGLGLGAGVLTGQNLGARRPERAERSGWLAAGMVSGFSVAGSIAILLWAENIIGVFTSDLALVKVTSTFLRIFAVGYLATGFGYTLSHCISGAGDTLMPMLVGLVTMWAVQVPLAFMIPRVTELGMYGVRWAMAIPLVLGGIAYVTYFRAGRWKRKLV